MSRCPGNGAREEQPSHLRTGVWGEKQAERVLRKKGHKILARRFRADARNEIDLVTRDGETLVFVEVKTRASEAFGRPAEAVDRHKRSVLSRAAIRYLQTLRFRPVYCRFDVVEVIGEREAGTPEIRHIENAFPFDRRYMLPM